MQAVVIPFRERNPIPIAIVGIAAMVGGVLAAFQAQNLPFIGCGTTYHADVSDASGLRPQDDVRVAGVRVGRVTDLGLHGQVVRVGFCLKGARLGDQTRADIRIKTLLGQKYLALSPDGEHRLDPDKPIPIERTSTPFDVTTAFIGLARNIEQTDTNRLAQAFTTLADTFKDTPGSVRQSLVGLERLSVTVSSRDAALRTLLTHAHRVTGVLAARDAEILKLVNDGDALLQTVEQQRAVIHALLVNTSTLSAQLSALVKENQSRLGPALRNVQRTLAILNDRQVHLDETIHLLAPFVRDFTNTLSNGRWFDTIVANLPAANLTVEPNP